MINYTEIAERLMNGKKVKPRQLVAFFARRHTNPMIQWQWEAMTTVNPAKEGGFGIIHFPNGSSRVFESRRIK